MPGAWVWSLVSQGTKIPHTVQCDPKKGMKKVCILKIQANCIAFINDLEEQGGDMLSEEFVLWTRGPCFWCPGGGRVCSLCGPQTQTTPVQTRLVHCLRRIHAVEKKVQVKEWKEFQAQIENSLFFSKMAQQIHGNSKPSARDTDRNTQTWAECRQHHSEV